MSCENQENKKEGEVVAEDTVSKEEYDRINAKKYLGLCNQGATCYMNSLLQSLYMTYEFRQKLYHWKYNERKQNKKEDCLPLQLQILFSRLQECKNRSFIDTKALIDTFGWTNSQMFQQQDVQEFCRVLFDAIEQSFENPKESEWIRDLYEGQTENFVFCKQCKSDSIRNDNFLDLQLIIRSDFDNIQNNSLEKCLKHFVQSVQLEGVNQYFCEKCNAKVDATKGVRLKTLPPKLMLQLNRFDLDYTTFQRKKICDRVYFPFVLNMNEFFKKYEDIQIEEPPQPKEAKPQSYESQSVRSKIINKRKASFDEGQGQDCKPLFDDEGVQAKKYGSEQGDKKEKIEGITFLDEVIKNKDQKLGIVKKQTSSKNPALFTRADEAYEFEENLVNDFALFADIDCQDESKQQKILEQQRQEGHTKKNVKIQKNNNTQADEAFDIETTDENFDANDYLPKDKSSDKVDDHGINWSTTVSKRIEQDEMFQKFKESNQKKELEKNQEIIKENIEANKQNLELINKYLQDGPYVYELYAVNVHSGGALGGHYFSYIKSFENGQWYNFNDSSVCKIRPSALENVYGQENNKSNQNTSAYMLMYRQVSLNDEKPISSPEVPEEILKLLQEEAEKEKKRIEESQIQQKLRERQIEFKIFLNQDESSIFFFDKYSQTLTDVRLAVMEKFAIKEDLSNWRIRAYSNYDKIMQEEFSTQETIPLVDLSLIDSKDLIIEFKKSDEKFEEYDPTKINVQFLVWEESIGLLENLGAKLTPKLKLLIRETETLRYLIEQLSEKLVIPKEEIIVLKKTNKSSNFRIMLLNDRESTLDNTLKQLDIYNNIQIFVEKKSDSPEPELDKKQEKKFAWETQIEKESHSCIIQFNNPRLNTKKGYSENTQQIMIDNRCTLRDAKNLISKKINLGVDKFIMKKNTLQNTDELKDLSLKLSDISIIHRGTLFLSEGVPQSIDEFLIDYRICKKCETTSLVINYESEHFAYMPTSTSLTVLELKEILAKKLKEEKNIEVKSAKCLRLQERYIEYKTILKNDKKLREYQLHDKKPFGITILDEEEDLKSDDVLIFTRFWDWNTKEVQNTIELVMKTYYDNKDFMHMIATYYNMADEDVEVYFIQSSKNVSLEGIAYEINQWKCYDDNFSISLVPWFLARDAETFIVRDRRLFSHNKQEIQSYLKGDTIDALLPQENSKYIDPNGKSDVKGKLPYKPMEVALKINLKKKVVVDSDEEGKCSEEKEKKEDDKNNNENKNDINNDDVTLQENNVKQSNNSKSILTAENNDVIVDSKENNDVHQDQIKETENQQEGKGQGVSIKEENNLDLDNDNLQTYPPTSKQQKESPNKKQKLVSFDEQFCSDYYQDGYEDEDATMQQMLIASLQEYQNSVKQNTTGQNNPQ